ncbi:GNAT family N-acetyltransferase [Rhizobium sp. S95]|uniref:GNAT family N-acetyltransferase n=1 Tax=Ciceribacter sichuanensis TaxID=2949647 RepID=A0AAJ1BXC5_9HYPH|nr:MULTISPECIES: GNAT family N-acetyltransferase [unclassified Ciceribacter]MCM2396922.1 GNAT family N-acetyltransferase [Ciceribacter sp. S95]MCO5957986.1 GNAT family N-acetyltransferase [Ciceribacter sp. S101]
MNPSDKGLADRSGLVFRQDYFDDPAGWSAIKTLLIDIFDVDISALDGLGGHDRTSFPSAYFDGDGRCIANLSAFSMPLMIDGRAIKAAGWQSGAVRPEYRGRGLYQDLIRITLDRCEEQGLEAIVLYTDKPGLYTPHGFRILPQYSFKGPAPAISGTPRPARLLDIDRDIDLLRKLLADRMPVSDHFAVADQRLMFLLNCHLIEDISLSLLADGKAVVVWRLADDGAFQLLDVAGSHIPPLAEIIASLGIAPASVEAFVTPDRLSWESEAIADTGSQVFMMRAQDEIYPTGPTCISPMAEF